jgi:hypothetical protein
MSAKATEGPLATMKTLNSKSPQVDKLREGHLLRWTKQLALNAIAWHAETIQILGIPPLEITMPKVNLSTMDIEPLTDLRKRIDQRLLECRADLEKQLARLDRSIGDKAIGLHRVGVSSLRGRKSWRMEVPLRELKNPSDPLLGAGPITASSWTAAPP